MARGAAARFGINKISGIDVDMEAHVASVEPDDSVRLRGCEVRAHLCLLDGVGGWQSLLGGNFIECNKHFGVDGA